MKSCNEEMFRYRLMGTRMCDDYYFLKLFSEYENYEQLNSQNIFFFEESNTNEMRLINKEFNLENIVGEGTDIEKISRIKDWAYKFLHYEGKTLLDKRYDNLSCKEIIEKSKTEGYSLNCRYISIIFTQFLLALGFKARWVTCLPMDLRYKECHCVTEVFLHSLNKWIIADAAFGLFYFDEKGKYLNLIEMRNMYIDGKYPIIITSHIAEKRYIQSYWMKNIFRFKFILKNKYNMLLDQIQEYACLNPVNFKMQDDYVKDHYTDKEFVLKYYYAPSIFW